MKQQQQQHNKRFHLFNPTLILENQKTQQYNKQSHNPQ